MCEWIYDFLQLVELYLIFYFNQNRHIHKWNLPNQDKWVCRMMKSSLWKSNSARYSVVSYEAVFTCYVSSFFSLPQQTQTTEREKRKSAVRMLAFSACACISMSMCLSMYMYICICDTILWSENFWDWLDGSCNAYTWIECVFVCCVLCVVRALLISFQYFVYTTRISRFSVFFLSFYFLCCFLFRSRISVCEAHHASMLRINAQFNRDTNCVCARIYSISLPFENHRNCVWVGLWF